MKKLIKWLFIAVLAYATLYVTWWWAGWITENVILDEFVYNFLCLFLRIAEKILGL
jgi:hypothetical protein